MLTVERQPGSLGGRRRPGGRRPDACRSAALERGPRPHLDREEAAILPLAAAHLTPEEWGKLPGHAMGSFGGDKIWLIIGLIRENFTQEQRDDDAGPHAAAGPPDVGDDGRGVVQRADRPGAPGRRTSPAPCRAGRAIASGA